MVVVVDVPHADRGGAFVFAVELAGVEHLLGHDARWERSTLPLCLGVNGLVFWWRVRWPTMRAKSPERQQAPLSVTIRWMWPMPCAANHTFALARNAAAVLPFSSGSGSV